MKIVIIGGTAAGMSAAAKARRTDLDVEIVLYEKRDIISLGACGLPYYIGDFFQDKNHMIARTVETARESGIDVQTKHEVLSIDPDKQTVKVKNLETDEVFTNNYDKLMIATGAKASIPPIKNTNLENVFNLQDLDDGLQIKEKVMGPNIKDVVIIGGGYIGVEVVEAMDNIGKNTRIIQSNSRLVPQSFDKEITDLMKEELDNQEVKVHLSELAKSLEGDDKVTGVITNKGSYKADMVIIATGVIPNTEFIKDTDIKMLKNGAIIIDEMGKTNIGNIYSAGDCATVYHKIREEDVYIPLATTANKIGRMVGENLVGVNKTFAGTLGSAAIKVMDLGAGRTGVTEQEAIDMGVDYETVFIKDKNQAPYYPGSEDIYVKLIYNSRTKVILGGQVIGKVGAVLRVDVLAAAIDRQMTTDELGNLDLCYSPPFSTTWDVLNIAGNVAE